MKPSEQNPRNSVESGEVEELAYVDDAIVARAFRWSFAVLVILVAAGAALWLALREKPHPAKEKLTALAAPSTPAHAALQELPLAVFTDITQESGIRFSHCNGAEGEKLLPEAMGSGAVFLDFDADGNQDLLFINSCRWPWTTNKSAAAPTMALYRNDGKGYFTDVTPGSGLDAPIFGMGAAIGDYDNDGFPDLFVSGVGGGRLFHNESGGKFKDVTAEAGVRGGTNDWSTACAWFDYDSDGMLDLLAANYVRWSRDIDREVAYSLVGVGRAYGQPFNFEGVFPRLYHNEGNGRFKEVTESAGLMVRNPSTGQAMAKTLGILPADLDGDGWIDIIVANDTVQNLVFHNKGGGHFEEIGARTGIAFDSTGMARGAMGIDAAHYRNDGKLGVAIGNFANEMTALYVAQSDPLLFDDEAIAEGIGAASRLLLKFGVFFFDYDLDGRLDLLTANGHLENEIGKIQASQTYAQPAQLFWNCSGTAGPGFAAVPAEKCGHDLLKPIVGRGAAYADIDGDGDLDVVLTQNGGPPLLLRNDQHLGNHWLRLQLTGVKGNRDAIGAWIQVRAGGQNIVRQVTPTKSYLSQSELPVVIGLGKVDHLDSLEITWPGGQRQRIESARIDGVTHIRQE